ncbi:MULTISPECIES: hypothetical protein [unclassified Variovorax]|uniref:hypothetical protein n=1 Tax=unclassified Variovorax TaxID=663243 RepID=UPI00076DD532|nr:MULTISPECIES: hypothetical protein [unclassified Variovorax]KWT69924.1 hypothetical protein APY03_6779 [Variovorax sp. WDL1]PNG46700.1 hypothetical protein CHC06_07043 [Variovorax sp. B2]PNG48649.1 hypothetical protein CHC07_07825 [Variovorax sp. B4]VTV14490.1 hypothetical protein WDL1CHR_05016 [Variovorax sp. WDL1]
MNAPLRAVALLCLALPLHVAHGQSSSPVDKPHAQNLTTAELKRVYLACDLASSRARLGMREAMQCSAVQEELKLRVFGGNFDQMLAWWREQRGVAEGRATISASP